MVFGVEKVQDQETIDRVESQVSVQHLDLREKSDQIFSRKGRWTVCGVQGA